VCGDAVFATTKPSFSEERATLLGGAGRREGDEVNFAALERRRDLRGLFGSGGMRFIRSDDIDVVTGRAQCFRKYFASDLRAQDHDA